MDYRELKAFHEEKLARFRQYGQQAMGQVQFLLREFMRFLGIREEQGLLKITPPDPEAILAQSEHDWNDCLAVGEDGWTTVAFRLAIGEDAYIFRFDLGQDDGAWVVHLEGESDEYLLPDMNDREGQERLEGFFDFLTQSLSDAIAMDYDLWPEEKKKDPRPIAFIVDERRLRAQLAQNQSDPLPPRS